MATEYQKYIIQAEHNLSVMKEHLYGNHDKGEPGLIDFNSQMADIYNRWYTHAESHKTKVVGDNKFAEFIRSKKLDYDDICKLFLHRSTYDHCFGNRLAECYRRLISSAEDMPLNKRKAVYSARGYKGELYKDLMLDIDGLGYRNNKFVKYADAMGELVAKRPANNNMDTEYSGRVIIPLTEEQNKKLDDIEAKYYDMLQDYNRIVWDKYNGIQGLYVAVRKIAMEKIPRYAGVKKELRNTEFADAYNIPRKYVRREEYNPYAWTEKERKIENWSELTSDAYLYM